MQTSCRNDEKKRIKVRRNKNEVFSDFNPFFINSSMVTVQRQAKNVTEKIRFFPGIMFLLFRLLQYHKGLPDVFRL